MNRKFWIAWIAVFVVWMAGSYLVHETLLSAEYAQLSLLFRPEAESQSKFGLMVLAQVMMAGAFTWIYSRGVTGAPWLGQGVRFGIAVALLTVIPTSIIYYVVQPMPGDLVTKQIIYQAIHVIVLGVTVAAVYRTQPRPA